MHLRHANACSVLYKPNFYLSYVDSSLKSITASKNVYSPVGGDVTFSESAPCSSETSNLYKKNNALKDLPDLYALHRDEINKKGHVSLSR